MNASRKNKKPTTCVTKTTAPSPKVATPISRSKRTNTKNNVPSLTSSSASSSSSTPPSSVRYPSRKSLSLSSSPLPKAVKVSKCCVCAKPEESQINQLIQCSTCQRSYHPFCHFVPIIVIPRQCNKWACLICKYKGEKKDSDSSSSATPGKEVYQVGSRMIKNQRTFENSANFRFEQACAKLKQNEIKNVLQNTKSALSGSLGNIRCHQHTAQIYTDNLARRAKRNSKQAIPLELIESYEKMSLNKTRCKTVLKSLQNCILSHRPHEPRIGSAAHGNVSCSICYSPESSNDNKILKCDNDGCCRAMHMKCTTPHVSQYELDNDPENTWFCCYCTAFARLIYHVQVEYEGDEEHIDEEWEDVDDVFAEAEAEEALAKKMRKAVSSGEGVGYVWKELMEGGEVEEESEENEDIEDDEEDEDFDPDKIIASTETNNNVDDDDSSKNSNISLGDLSSVDSLSDDEVDTLTLQSKQRFKKKDKDTGMIDEENILKGKRNRTSVDYRKLNDELFSHVESKDIDDEDEYQHNENPKKVKKKNRIIKVDTAQSPKRKRDRSAKNKDGAQTFIGSPKVVTSSPPRTDASPAAAGAKKVPSSQKGTGAKPDTKIPNKRATRASLSDVKVAHSPKKAKPTVTTLKKRTRRAPVASTKRAPVADSIVTALLMLDTDATRNRDTAQSPKWKPGRPVKNKDGVQPFIGSPEVAPSPQPRTDAKPAVAAANAKNAPSSQRGTSAKPDTEAPNKRATRASLSDVKVAPSPKKAKPTVTTLKKRATRPPVADSILTALLMLDTDVTQNRDTAHSPKRKPGRPAKRSEGAQPLIISPTVPPSPQKHTVAKHLKRAVGRLSKNALSLLVNHKVKRGPGRPRKHSLSSSLPTTPIVKRTRSTSLTMQSRRSTSLPVHFQP